MDNDPVRAHADRVAIQQLHDEVIELRKAVEDAKLELRQEIVEMKRPVDELKEWMAAGKVGSIVLKWLLGILASIGAIWAAFHGVVPKE